MLYIKENWFVQSHNRNTQTFQVKWRLWMWNFLHWRLRLLDMWERESCYRWRSKEKTAFGCNHRQKPCSKMSPRPESGWVKLHPAFTNFSMISIWFISIVFLFISFCDIFTEIADLNRGNAGKFRFVENVLIWLVLFKLLTSSSHFLHWRYRG